MTDSQIIDLYWQRTEAAIAETNRVYGRYCHSIAYGILRDREDAQEVVSDAYLKLWDLIPPQRPDPFRGFLGRIVRQLSINRLEHDTAKKRGSGEYALALEELGDVFSDNAPDPAERLALRTALEDFLRALPAQARRIFLKRYWYLLSIRDIAGELGLGQSNVKMQLLRTRQKLREHLQKEGLL